MSQSSMETSDCLSANPTSPSSTADGAMDTDDELESLYKEVVSNQDNSTTDDEALSSGVRDMLISKKSLLNKLSAWVQRNKK